MKVVMLSWGEASVAFLVDAMPGWLRFAQLWHFRADFHPSL